MKENIKKKNIETKTQSSKASPTRLSRKPKIDDYNKSKPEQLSLFELIHPSEKDYSNTIELYDFIPKYVWGRVEPIQENS